jgi:hypothetical protein
MLSELQNLAANATFNVHNVFGMNTPTTQDRLSRPIELETRNRNVLWMRQELFFEQRVSIRNLFALFVDERHERCVLHMPKDIHGDVLSEFMLSLTHETTDYLLHMFVCAW